MEQLAQGHTVISGRAGMGDSLKASPSFHSFLGSPLKTHTLGPGILLYKLQDLLSLCLVTRFLSPVLIL